MDYTSWAEQGQSSNDRDPDATSEGRRNNFSDSVGNKLDAATVSTRNSSDATELSFDFEYHDRGGTTAPWGPGPTDLPGGISNDHEQLLWEDDYSNLEQFSAIDLARDNANVPSFEKGEFDSRGLLDTYTFDFDREENLQPNYNAQEGHHRRGMSDAFTMRVPLVSPMHKDGMDQASMGPAQLSTGDPHDRSLGAATEAMRTPVRDGHLFDRYAQDSPSYFVNGLESPLESPALQSPYLSYQPFPAVPSAVGQNLGNMPGPGTSGSGAATSIPMRAMQSAGSPQTRQKSASLSQSSTASPRALEASESKAVEQSPQTPRTRIAGINKPKHKKAASSVSATPMADLASGAGIPENPGTPSTETSSTPTTANSDTPSRAGAASNASAGKEPRKDGRKRIGKDQIEILEASFHQNPRPEREDRLRLAAETNLEQRTVQIWFQNRRAKSRSMKMPPSQADTSMHAIQYRVAAAAASNAAANTAAGGRSTRQAGNRASGNRQGNASSTAANSAMGFPGPMGPAQGVTAMKPGSMNSGSMNSGSTNSGSMNSGSVDYDYWNAGSPSAVNNRPAAGRRPPLHRNASTGAFTGHVQTFQTSPVQPQMQKLYRHYPRWNSVSVSPSQPYIGYHQQLPKHGVTPSPGASTQIHRAQQQAERMQMSEQMQQHMPQMQLGGGFGSGSGMEPINSRSRSYSMFEPISSQYPMEQDFDNTMYGNKPMSFGSSHGRSDSMLSLASMNSAFPPSPMLADGKFAGNPDMRSLQNSPEMVSPVAWPSHLSRSQSAVTLHGPLDEDYPVVVPENEVKRRRSIYGNPVPNWNPQAEVDPVMSARASPTSVPENQASNMGTPGSLAASAAAAALRTRNRSNTQPQPRSRQPSIRLQLDDSSSTAQLVVISDDQDDRGRGQDHTNDNRDRDMSPERAESAAEKLLAERAAAATSGRRPSSFH